MRSVVYDDFSGGDWGITKLTAVKPNQWYGTNVQVFPDGSIGPRNGILQYLPGGLPTTSTVRPSILYARDGRIFFIIGATVYYLTSGTLTTVTGSLTGGSSSSAAQIYTDLRLNRYWINRVGLGLDYVSGTTLTAVTTPVAFRMIAVKGDRMLGTSGRVVYFSAAGDFTSWPALNQIDLGEGSDIQWIHSSGDTVYVATEATLFAIQGTLGSTTTVRQIANVGAPILRAPSATTGVKEMDQEPWRAAKLDDDTIAWLSGEDPNVILPVVPGVGNSEFRPGICKISWFKGGSVRTTTHSNYSLGAVASSTASYEVHHAAARDALLLFPQGFRSSGEAIQYFYLVRPDGYAEKHQFSIAAGRGYNGPGNDLGFIVNPQVSVERGAVMDAAAIAFATRDTSNNIRFYTWKSDPGIPNNNNAITTDATNSVADFGSVVTLAPFYADSGQRVKVRGVDVYGTAYGSGSGNTTLTVQVVPSGVDNLADGQSASPSYADASQTIDPGNLYATSFNPAPFVHRFRFGNSSLSAGYWLTLSLKRCSVAKVVVHLDVKEVPVV